MDPPGYQRPSRELLEFYRTKITEYEHEDESFLTLIDGFKTTTLEQSQIDSEVKARDQEIAELQKALSDMQSCLFKEREQVLKLHQENDKFKGREFDNKKTMQQLLALRGGAQDGEISYFFKEPPEQLMVINHTKQRRGQDGQIINESGIGDNEAARMQQELKELQSTDCVSLQLQIEALKSQLDDQARWSREFLQALNEDKTIKHEEDETREIRDLEKIKTFAQKLHTAQDILYNNTQTVLNMREQSQTTEQNWIREKRQLLMQLDRVQGFQDKEWIDRLQSSITTQQPNLNKSNNVPNFQSDQLLNLQSAKKKLREELEASRRMCEMYREQLISFEDEIAAYRDKENYTTDIFKDKSSKMEKRYSIMRDRYRDLEKRRNLEVEGFKNDIKSLRKQVKDMEKHIYKATLKCTNMNILSANKSSDELDLHIYHDVKKSNRKSRAIDGTLRNLKGQVYQLQTDLKHL